MIDLADTRWLELTGGCGSPYDPRPVLARLEREEIVEDAWKELWDELHHQGDIGTAAYAVVPHLVRIHAGRGVPDWNTYALLGVIELARDRDANPALPTWLRSDYDTAWERIVPLGLRDLGASNDATLTRSALGVLAVARGLRRQGEVLLTRTDDEFDLLLGGGDR